MPSSLSPAEVFPFILALVAATGGAYFARRRNDARPFSLVSAILYAVAVGCFLLGVIAWVTRGS